MNIQQTGSKQAVICISFSFCLIALTVLLSSVSDLIVAQLFNCQFLFIGNLLKRFMLVSESFEHHLLLVDECLEFLLAFPAVVLLSLDLVP